MALKVTKIFMKEKKIIEYWRKTDLVDIFIFI
jgi:hypothetical protein